MKKIALMFACAAFVSVSAFAQQNTTETKTKDKPKTEKKEKKEDKTEKKENKKTSTKKETAPTGDKK